MTVIYHTTITRIGACATMALEEQMLITFREGAPADIEEYCFIHNHGELAGPLTPGAELQLGDRRYPGDRRRRGRRTKPARAGPHHPALRRPS
ncbi:PTS system glucitol/sorbitol-specific transporter subunit IIA [Klebsiella variicola]|nr:PTS system glucitol/sorbitol-specific transporter subunit IIA [Klebsiella variicola]